MTAIEFVISKIKQIASKFDEITILYENRISTKSHIVEILPIDIFESDSTFFELEDLVEKEFYEKFPEEDIVFVSEASISRVRKIDYIYINMQAQVATPINEIMVKPAYTEKTNETESFAKDFCEDYGDLILAA